MPSVGPTELIIILVIIVIIFGAGKLPEVGGALGRGIREFRASSREDDTTDDASTTNDSAPKQSKSEPAKEEL